MKTIIIFDLEATCWERGIFSREVSEIIEIGAVRLNRDTGDIISEFQTFVRPTIHPILSKYCTDLTKISQEEVDSAPGFAESMNAFNNWLGNSDDYILSWGVYDKVQILRESNNKVYHLDSLENKIINKHINMKEQYSYVRGAKKQFGMATALRQLDLPLDGSHHRAIDDVKNLVKIYNVYKDKFFKVYV